MGRIAVISITKSGDFLAEKLGESFNIHLYSKNHTEGFDFKKVVKASFENYDAVVFITSTGIAVRGIAPYIKNKVEDPAVVVIDSSGKFVISLLSGHLGGANKLTEEIADILKAQPIITTATDNLGIIAPDMIAASNNLIIDSLLDAKTIASLLVSGEKVGFYDEEGTISCPPGYTPGLSECSYIVYVTNKANKSLKQATKSLKLIRKNIILGIGCKKDYPVGVMKEKVINTLKEYNIDERAIKSIATVEIKKDEKAIIELSNYFGCEMKIFNIEEIKAFEDKKDSEDKYEGSSFVEKTLGIRGVCEPVVELAGGKLEVHKMKLQGMTLAIGKEV